MAAIASPPFTGIIMTIYVIYRLVHFLMNWMGSGFEPDDSEENRNISRFKGCLLLFVIWVIFAIIEYLYISMMSTTLEPYEIPQDFLLQTIEYYFLMGFVLSIDILWQTYQLRDYVIAVFDAHIHSTTPIE